MVVINLLCCIYLKMLRVFASSSICLVKPVLDLVNVSHCTKESSPTRESIWSKLLSMLSMVTSVICWNKFVRYLAQLILNWPIKINHEKISIFKSSTCLFLQIYIYKHCLLCQKKFKISSICPNLANLLSESIR